ncbi:twin-arginine translocase TatA/TatE family subunit [uncultured Roseibium sp.]|uniref:twin-arginine translocase TatA/TatE family subunit n=1 Tax=uncultured Roseibium sp. TaxID=1936171 RepID=UPI0026312B78|nr:twin-arginine translocase TatA/TatE family subunit [uncultured Roseibium sp.]
MGISIWQILIIAVVVVLLFGRGKISELMGDVAKGIKSFKKGMAEDDTADTPKTIDHQNSEAAPAAKAEDQTKAS